MKQVMFYVFIIVSPKTMCVLIIILIPYTLSHVFQNQNKNRQMSRFRPSRHVETLRDEMSCLKSGLNISGVISRPQLWPFFEF